MVRILRGYVVEAHNEAHVLGVLAEYHVHLSLTPCRVVSLAVLLQKQSDVLRGGVVSRRAPAVGSVPLGRVAHSLLSVLFGNAPVAVYLAVEDCRAEVDVVPAVLVVGVLLVVFEEGVVLLVLGREVEEARREGLVVLAVARRIKRSYTLGSDLIELGREIEQRLCVCEVLLIAEVDVVHRESRRVLSRNVARAARGLEHLSRGAVLLLGRSPVAVVVGVSVAYLVYEVSDRSAARNSAAYGGAVLEIFAEVVGDELEVPRLTEVVEYVLVLVVAPAERCARIARCYAEFYVVAAVVVAAGDGVIGVAVVAPREAALLADLTAAHIRVVHIQRILQELGVVVGVLGSDDRRSCEHTRRRAGSSRHKRGKSRCYPADKVFVLHLTSLSFSELVSANTSSIYFLLPAFYFWIILHNTIIA